MRTIIIGIFTLIFQCINAQSATNITQAEYFYNTDPGFGNGTSIPITQSNAINITPSFAVNSSILNEGVNFLYTRIKDENNKWSLSARKPFYIYKNDNYNVTAAEYFYNTDPGFGNATPITIPSGNMVELKPQNFVLNQVPTGINFLYLRFKDANNKWSLPIRKVFFIPENYSATSNITAAEYFYNTDPGFGNATPITIPSGNMVELKPQNFVLNQVPTGINFLYLRFKDANNKWSLPIRKVFYIPENYSATSNITAAEYFIDSDPGIDAATPIAVTQGNIVQQIVDLPYTNLNMGDHILYIRVKNSNGTWSFVKKKTFTVNHTLGTVDGNSLDEINFYPNPVENYLYFKNNKHLKINNVEIYNYSGQKVYATNVSDNKVNLEFLPKGIYLIKIIVDNNKIITKKIVKK